MMNIARFWPPYRRLYRRGLAQHTALIDGAETRKLARAMGYDADLLRTVTDDAKAQVRRAEEAAKGPRQQIEALQQKRQAGDIPPERAERTLAKLRDQRDQARQKAYASGLVPLEPRDTYRDRLQEYLNQRKDPAA